jgi:hypothetical protein
VPLELIGAALGVHPDDGIARAMFLCLLFGAEGGQDGRRLPASRTSERESHREQNETLAVRDSSVQCQVNHFILLLLPAGACDSGLRSSMRIDGADG